MSLVYILGVRVEKYRPGCTWTPLNKFTVISWKL